MNRRGFMKAILAAGAAPYVQTAAGVLMPVRKLVVPEYGMSPALVALDALRELERVMLFGQPRVEYAGNLFVGQASVLHHFPLDLVARTRVKYQSIDEHAALFKADQRTESTP